MFRWLLGTPGLAVDIDGVCRVQHVQKGRYADTGSVTSLRRPRPHRQHRASAR